MRLVSTRVAAGLCGGLVLAMSVPASAAVDAKLLDMLKANGQITASQYTELQAELAKAQEATVNAEKFMKVVRKYTSFEELTHTLLREFIEKIVVHECSYDENGTRRQDIDIYYSFVGKVDLPE